MKTYKIIKSSIKFIDIRYYKFISIQHIINRLFKKN